MDLYLILKLVHVVGAILWVGGASIMTLLVVVLDRRGDDAATLTAVSYVALLGNRVFLPLSLLVILSGLVLAWMGAWGLAAWTVLATLIVVATAVLGGAVLGPTTERAVKVWRDGDAAQAMALGRRLLRLIKVDLGGQFAIIALMVLKPGWTDPALLIPAAILATGAALSLLPGRAGAGTAQPA